MIGGFLFLVAIIDLFSRQVVGWSLRHRLDANLLASALRRALAEARPTAGADLPHGPWLEYAARSFRDRFCEAHALPSMSRKGDCSDNAVAESYFSTLEFEGPSTTTSRYISDEEPKEVFTFIERYYNEIRLHSHECYKSPNETEADLRMGALAASMSCRRNRGKLTLPRPRGRGLG